MDEDKRIMNLTIFLMKEGDNLVSLVGVKIAYKTFFLMMPRPIRKRTDKTAFIGWKLIKLKGRNSAPLCGGNYFFSAHITIQLLLILFVVFP